jgi:hypothetical protein
VTDVPRKTTARAAELDRLSVKIERLLVQRVALRRAMRQFGTAFDAEAWKRSFDSPDPDDINRVFMVTGGYLALVNNMAEAIKAGARLTGVKAPAHIAGLPGTIDAIRLDGGFTKGQADTFAELCRTRNRLQHSSPDIQADEVHRQVSRLLRHLPRLVQSYVAWLEKRGVEL